MTTTPQQKLSPCREAFEQWYFAKRNEMRAANIVLDENDANSMWHGWEAAWDMLNDTPSAALVAGELNWQLDLQLVKLNIEQMRKGVKITDDEVAILLQRLDRTMAYVTKKFRG